MTSDAAAIAVLLRKAQWLLDDVAYEVAAGRSKAIDLSEVAGVLEGVATVLRSCEDAAPASPIADSDLSATPLDSVDSGERQRVVRLERGEVGEKPQLPGRTTPGAIDSALVASFPDAHGESNKTTRTDSAYPSAEDSSP
ncbi:hypothetical protein [Saccharopolyspora griseoalba]|uniref:Uncharacterized protein n=1 Tax=Saccharopolyspora griseoalba TaxID=1431848 RepID=A0ABW2LNT8_9PSEU